MMTTVTRKMRSAWAILGLTLDNIRHRNPVSIYLFPIFLLIGVGLIVAKKDNAQQIAWGVSALPVAIIFTIIMAGKPETLPDTESKTCLENLLKSMVTFIIGNVLSFLSVVGKLPAAEFGVGFLLATFTSVLNWNLLIETGVAVKWGRQNLVIEQARYEGEQLAKGEKYEKGTFDT